jgi:hypothetical protein
LFAHSYNTRICLKVIWKGSSLLKCILTNIITTSICLFPFSILAKPLVNSSQGALQLEKMANTKVLVAATKEQSPEGSHQMRSCVKSEGNSVRKLWLDRIAQMATIFPTLWFLRPTTPGSSSPCCAFLMMTAIMLILMTGKKKDGKEEINATTRQQATMINTSEVIRDEQGQFIHQTNMVSSGNKDHWEQMKLMVLV